MARVNLVNAGLERIQLKLYYTVDAAVGPRTACCPNRRDDVLLVQYFLREVFKGENTTPSGGPVVVHGNADRATLAAILEYQKFLKQGGSSIATDGRVDPPLRDQMMGPILRTQYTILYLNLHFARVRPMDWPHVGRAHDCPPELRLLLQEPVFIHPDDAGG